MPVILKKATVEELAMSLVSTIDAGLPEGVKFMVVVTDYSDIGIAGSLSPAHMAQACINILEQLPEAVGKEVDPDAN